MTDAMSNPDDVFERWTTVLERGSFEEILLSLQDIVDCLESGRLPLDASVRTFEIGMSMSARADALLTEAELRVSHISTDWEDRRQPHSLPTDSPDSGDDFEEQHAGEEPPF